MSKVSIYKNGPAVIEGDELVVFMPDGTEEKKNKIAICRCGKSKDGIMCDGSHVQDNAVW